MTTPAFMLAEPLGFHLPALAAYLRRREEINARFPQGEGLKVKVDSGEPRALSLSDIINSRREFQVTPDGFGIVHVAEVLSRSATKFDELFGDTNYNSVIGELENARTDSNIRGVLLDVASLGGSAVGAPEAAAAVAAFRESGKPIVAYIETLGASAAYYAAAAANAVISSPSAIVGSIGTIAMYQNIAELLAKLGIEIEIFTPEKADLKAAGNSYRKMTPEERKFVQSGVESINADFHAWVKRNRKGVEDEAMRGQWFYGAQALASGLIDGTGSYSDAFRKLATIAPNLAPARPPVGKDTDRNRILAALPEVIGNESWRAALEDWESPDVTAEQLARVPASASPGKGYSAHIENSGDAHKKEEYLPARIERLRFEIKRCGGQVMKPFSRKPSRERAYWNEDHYELSCYARELSVHLRALLTSHPDQQLAAAVRAANLPKDQQ